MSIGDVAPIPSVDSARYRQVMGHFATGVTIVTTMLDGRPAGMAVNSFTSVSLEPAIVAICVSRDSTTWPKIRQSGAFCANILAEDQEDLCRRFAARRPDKFVGVGWSPAESGAPLLTDALAWVDCVVEAEFEGGDHMVVLGRVRDLGVTKEGMPLIFYRGGYGSFRP